jgi:hypothetical protein
MARESEGFKWALIVFVCLTILLGATSFLTFSQYKEANEKAKAATTKANESNKAVQQAITDMESLKQMMGVAVSETIQTISEQFKKDMQAYAADFPEETQRYRQVLERHATVLRQKNEELDKATNEVEQLKTYIVSLDAATQPKIDAFSKEAQKAQADREAELAKFDKNRESLISQQNELDGALKKTRDETEAKLAGMQSNVDQVNEKITKVTGAYDSAKGKIDAMTRENPDSFHGEIRWVNQRNKVAWINLGSADALRNQMTFSVYTVGANDTTDSDKKATVEVTRVLGDHLAEARILSDIDDDPIIPGDQIFTPVWNVGQRRHFAIVGEIDLDGDGRPDLEQLHTLIEMNGGVIDARKDKEGKRQGKMSMDTRYLILGETPDSKSSQAVLDDYSQMQSTAEELRVETIIVEKLLDQMGWNSQSEVLVFGDKGASGKAFDVRPNERTTQSHSGVSDLFKPRKPVRKYGGSTF